MSTLDAAFSQLPEPIQNKLESMIRRVRRLLLIRGLCATLAVALACILGIMAIDAIVTLFSPAGRWALSLIGLAITLTAAWWFLMRPLSRRISLTQMARIIEVRHPELQERISTAVELLSSNEPDSIKGSEELISAVVDSAIDDVDAVDPRSEFNPIRTAKFGAVAGGFAIFIAILLLIWPTQSWTLLTRAVAPFLDIGNAYADSLVVEPGDYRIAQGESVTIELSVNHKKLRRAEIRRLLADGSESIERMALDSEAEDGTRYFSITFPNVQEDFSYRIRAGSALTRYFLIDTVIPPQLENMTVRYDYPDYTELPHSESVTATGEIRSVAHTQVTISATTTNPVHSAELVINNSINQGAPEVDEETLTWNFELMPGMSGNWKLDLVDADGFTNAPAPYPIEVLPDKAPTVQIFRPSGNELKLRPTEQLEIHSAVIEDFGFSGASFLISPTGDLAPWEIEIPLPSPTNTRETYTSSGQINLSSIALPEGQKRFSVQVLAKDSRPADYDGPGIGLSEPIFITLDESAKSLAQQAVEAKQKEVAEKLNTAKQELERARNDMRRTEQELKRSDQVTERALNPLKDFSEHTESARNKLDEMAATLDESFLQEEADHARKIANDNITEAREQADLIPVTESKSERLKMAQEARQKIEKAIKELDRIQKAVAQAREEFEMISQLSDLASQQQQLAQNAKEWAEEAKRRAAEMEENGQDEFAKQQQQDLDEFREQQEQVQQELGQMLKDNAAALDEILKGQQLQADQMAEEASALAKEQEQLRKINQEATQAKTEKQNQLRDQLIEHLQKQEEHLAKQATEKAATDQPKSDQASDPKDNPAEAELMADAAKEATSAADQLSQKNLDAAAENAVKASQLLAESVEPESPAEAKEATEPANQKPSSAQADAILPSLPSNRALAKTQEALAKQIEMVRDGDLQGALSAMESQLNQEAAALSQDAQSFEKTLKNLSQKAAEKASDQAGKSLDQGAEEAGQAADQLAAAEKLQDQANQNETLSPGDLAQPAQAAMQRAQADQQQSAKALASAAAAFSASSKAIGQTMDGMEPSDQDSQIADSEELAEGFEEVSESARSTDAQEAAGQSQEAAESLQQLAQSAMKKLGKPSDKPGTPNQPPGEDPNLAGEPDATSLNETGQKAADANGSGIPPELESMGISAEDWARFKGALVGGNAASIETELPVEYRELVGRYFQVIAKEAGKDK